MPTLKRVENPISCPEGYSMDLYCDRWDGSFDTVHGYAPFPVQYHGDTRGECAREARRDGWILHTDYTATCPKCSGKRRS
jgi:hypothetical protein